MIIIGGTYREVSMFPEKNVLFGSGLKAACAVSAITKVEFFSAISKEDHAEAQAIASSFDIQATFVMRDAPIEFHYLTPLTTPRIYGLGQSTQLCSNTAENALVFGLLESDPEVTARGIVYDPQRPKGAKIDRSKLKCEKFAIVLNKHEAKEISNENNIEESAKKILKDYIAEVVVVKCGALGALVVDKSSVNWIGAHPSNSVWPIGSGDIFSAVFATSWLEQKKTPVESARLASLAVSEWTTTPDLLPISIPTTILQSKILSANSPKIYLAGPFFNLGQNWLIETSKSALENLGAEVFSPLHNVGRGGDEVAMADLEGLDNCNSVLALLDEYDTGTIFEVGYAQAKGIKVIGYSQNPSIDQLKMVRGSGIPVFSDFSTAVYQAIWAGV